MFYFLILTHPARAALAPPLSLQREGETLSLAKGGVSKFKIIRQ